jgi:phosphoribosyl-ATP pyrophosphohydrolase/phosphoribosyl-AMP cyclohydrolase
MRRHRYDGASRNPIVLSVAVQNGKVVQANYNATSKGWNVVPAGELLDAVQYARIAGEVRIVDIDASQGTGSNVDVISKVLPYTRCGVGGGISDPKVARHYLDAGADRIIIGTAATAPWLLDFPRKRLSTTVSVNSGVVESDPLTWSVTGSKDTLRDRIDAVRSACSELIVSFTGEHGLDIGAIEAVTIYCSSGAEERQLEVTYVARTLTVEEVVMLDRIGVCAQVEIFGSSGERYPLHEVFAACLSPDTSDGLVATVVTTPARNLLGVCLSSRTSLSASLTSRKGTFASRSGPNWSQDQELLEAVLDCDRDTILFVTAPSSADFCHAGATCFGPLKSIDALFGSKSEIPDKDKINQQIIQTAKEIQAASTDAYKGMLCTDLIRQSIQLARAANMDPLAFCRLLLR